MKATELRIGNLFIEKKTKTIIKIIGLTEEIITFSGNFKNDWQAEPVPLTEDWLVKFGLVCDNEVPYVLYTCKVLSIYKEYGVFWIHILNDTIELKHVHQLQNLYFALTGEELEIKI